MSGDGLGCHLLRGAATGSGGLRTEVLLHTLHCTGQVFTTNNYLVQNDNVADIEIATGS